MVIFQIGGVGAKQEVTHLRYLISFPSKEAMIYTQNNDQMVT